MAKYGNPVAGSKDGTDDGQMAGKGAPEQFANPTHMVTPNIKDMQSLKDDIGEKSGFEANHSAYINKKGMCYGEAAKLNMMPPGMSIDNQEYSDIRDMPLKQVTSESFPGDGWQ